MASQQPSRTRHLRTPSEPVTSHATRLRPAFTTLQQHYSPAKSSAPKPLTSTYLAPPSPSKRPANVAATAETSKLQTELLQLHLLHRDAAAVDAEWRASARRKLGERFSRLGDASRDVGQREKRRAETDNLLVLRSWGRGGALDDRIQALDAVVSGLWTLSEPGGRYARVLRRFERWIDRVSQVEEARNGKGGMPLGDQDSLFVDELDAAWKDDCAGLVRRLDGWQRQLQEIGSVPEQGVDTERSSLARILEASRSMIQDMLTELNAMEEMEREALAREERWIEEMNKDDDDNDTPRAGAIWRAI